MRDITIRCPWKLTHKFEQLSKTLYFGKVAAPILWSQAVARNHRFR